MEAAPLQYLTAQDVLWIHQRIVGKALPFHYRKLEDAANRQFLYGEAKGPIVHALHFFKGFRSVKPFGEADDEAAFLSMVAFLKMNGKEFNLPDSEAKSWLERIQSGQINFDEALTKLAHESHSHGMTVREALESTALAYPSLIR